MINRIKNTVKSKKGGNKGLTQNTHMHYLNTTAAKVAVGIDTPMIEKGTQSLPSRLFLCPQVKLLCHGRLCERAARFAALTFSSGSINLTHVCHPLFDTKGDGSKFEKGDSGYV